MKAVDINLIENLDRLHAEERLALLSNLLDLREASERQQKMQSYARRLCRLFAQADWLDSICSMFGWRLAGLGYLELDIDDEQVDFGCSLEWVAAGDDDRIVRLDLADEPELKVTEDGGICWRPLSTILELVDLLGGWVELQETTCMWRNE